MSPSPPCPPATLDALIHDADTLIRAALAVPGEKVVIVDDDPTGTQAFRDIPVHFEWSVAALESALASELAGGFFLTTNSRGRPEPEAIRINREIGTNLRAAERRTGRRCHLISRSDSTLRGHFPAELEALMAGYGEPFDAVLLAPFFHEGGRITRDSIHYIRKPDGDTPVADTEFARDPVFGYASSHLPHWVEEKSHGRIRAGEVHAVSLETIRRGGAPAVAARLLAMTPGSYCVINAECPADMGIAVAGTLLCGHQGRRYIWRSAASAAQARLGQASGPLLLDDSELPRLPAGSGGLVIVGSHVQATTRQVTTLLQHHADAVGIEVGLDELTGPARDRHVTEIARAVDAALAAGRLVVVYTARTVSRTGGPDAFLALGEQIMNGFAAVVRTVRQTPRFLVAKGGITSHRMARDGLGLRSAWVRGPLLPGVPVWRCPTDSRWPGIDYVVFPGNVGDDDALLRAVQRLSVP